MQRYLFHHLFYSTLVKKKIRHPLHGAQEINFHPSFMHTRSNRELTGNRLCFLVTFSFSSWGTMVGMSMSAFCRMVLTVVLPPPVGPTNMIPWRTMIWL